MGRGRLVLGALITIAGCLGAAASGRAGSVTLSWTAPGDNGSLGRAATYQLRLSSTPPGADTLAWWNASASAPSVPAPRPAGSPETLLVAGLAPSVEYFFAVRATDESGNSSAISNVARATSSADSGSAPPDSGDALPDSIAPAVSAVVISPASREATVSWQTDEASDGQVAFGIGGDLSLLSALDSTRDVAHAITLTALLPETSYSCRVSSRDSSGNSGSAGPFSFRTAALPDTTPPVVSALSMTSITQTRARVAWRTDEAARAWVEYGRTAAYGNEALSGDSSATEHEVLLDDLVADTEYHARVVAVDADGNRAETVDLAFATLPKAGVPADSVPPAVALLEAVAESPNRVRVAWSTDEASTGDVLYRPAGGGAASAVGDSSTGKSHAISLSGLAPQTRFTFQIVARDTAGNLTVAGPWEIETPSDADRTPPVVTAVSAEATSPTRAVVRWRTDEAADSQVEYGPTSALGLATPLDDTLRTEHEVSLSGLEPGVDYSFRILSRDASGNLTRAALAGFSTPPIPVVPADTVPPAIDSVRAIVLGPSSVRVAWSTDEPADAQVSFRSGTGPASLSARDGRLLRAHEVVLEGLRDGTEWTFAVISVDSAGNRAESAPSGFETPSASDTTRPQISGISVAAVTAQSAEIRWATDEPADQQVEYGESAEYGFATPLDETYGLGHTVRLTALQAGTAYHYRILSRDRSGNLSRSADGALTTAPIGGAPGDTVPPIAAALSIESLDPTRVRVRWMTNEPSDGQIEYGLSLAFGLLSRGEGALGTAHALDLEGLAPGTEFHCRALSRDAEGNVGRSDDLVFTTEIDREPPPPAPAVRAMSTQAGFLVEWSAAEAPDIAGYRVYRSVGGGYSPIATASVSDRSYLDEEVPGAVREVSYAVAAIDKAGNESAWTVVSIVLALDLSPAIPNPANPGTRLRFRIPPPSSGSATRVTLSVYDVAGALVKSLFDGPLGPGAHVVNWDGGDWRGDPVPSGIYFARLSSGTVSAAQKVTVLR